MRGWSVWAAPLWVLTACGGAGAETIDFGDTHDAGGDAPTGGVTDTEGDGEAASGGEDESTGETTDAPTVVPLSVDTIDVSGPCTPLAVDERVVAVGPNGETWLAQDAGDGTVVRTFGVDGERDFGFTTESPLVAASAIDGEGGAFVTTDGLFTVRGPRVDLLSWPNDPADIVALCGDLSVDGDGRVLADDVFTRDLGQWWRWNAPEQAVGPAMEVGMQAGACSDRSGAGFVLRGDTVWSVRSEFVETLPAFGPASAVVGHDAFGLASIVDGEVLVGRADEDPEVFAFEAGVATALAAGDDALYVLAGGRIYALRDGAFAELTTEGESLHADELHGAGAGGVVVDREAEICFRGPAEPIEILGVRPASHRRVASLDVTVYSPAIGLQATLDGNPVPLDIGDAGAMRLVTVDLDEGWHTLEIAHDGASRIVEFSVERLTPATFAEDIVPLFEEHCSGAGCHGPASGSDERPDLSVYDVWVDLAETVRTRVAVSADMPPPGTSDWGVEDTLLVLGWLDAGLPEGE